MINRVQRHASAIVISVAFYVSCFFAVANLVPFGSYDIALGLFAGAVGGLFALITKLMISGRNTPPCVEAAAGSFRRRCRFPPHWSAKRALLHQHEGNHGED